MASSLSGTACNNPDAGKSTSVELLQWLVLMLAFLPLEPQFGLWTSMLCKVHNIVLTGWRGEVLQLHCQLHPYITDNHSSFVVREEYATVILNNCELQRETLQHIEWHCVFTWSLVFPHPAFAEFENTP